jgi:hypothetical protein
MKKRLLLHSILSASVVLLLTACGGDTMTNSSNNPMNHPEESTQPTLSLKGDESVSLIIGDTFTDLGVVSSDTVTVQSDVNTSKAGTYTVTYTATNSTGQTASLKRTVVVSAAPSMAGTIPIDANIELGGESNILYYADPRPEENGQNRALRIDYGTMTFEALTVRGINPHSIDRAGETDRFYIRTQNSYSFDVVNFNTKNVKTVDLPYKPRAIGAYNKKHNLQLISVKDMPVIGVIDVSQDRVIRTVGNQNTYNASQITSNAGSGSATGHAIWLDEDHFVLIDRVNRVMRVYRVSKRDDGGFNFQQTSSITTGTALHALERVVHPKTRKDLVTFYALGEGDLTKGFSPYILELSFDSTTGNLSRTGKTAWLSSSTQEINNVKPTTHHAGISPDGKYLVVPVFDGKVYFINRKTMDVEKTLQAKLGAAHIEFSAQEGLAVITNHFAQELTIIDMKTLSVKKNLRISNHGFNPNEKHLLQPHFSYISPDGRYFYTFATQDGDFLKIDLQTLEIVDKLHTGGAPEQAHS